jgi:catechol 2,3-dioxygenase-like lactoylglutathione lyase family enzyme
MISVKGINHVTLCCSAYQLKTVQNFYQKILGLTAGPRPPFSFSGSWLYAGNEPIVHLAAVLEESVESSSGAPSMPSATPATTSMTGAIDHVALRINGPVDACRKNLVASGITFTEAPVPDFPIYQLFLQDPLGVKIELNFELTS